MIVGFQWVLKCMLMAMLLEISNQCEIQDFVCSNGHCLPREKVCDGFFDCDDGDDENNCRERTNCVSPTWFECKSKQCISSLMYCDGFYDCSDQSDEPENCTADGHLKKTESVCSDDEFQCLNKKCIKNTWACDGDVDCLDGSDETVGCKHEMKCEGGFRCKNHHCIIKEFHCDGDNDCGDNSDEENCTQLFHSVESCHKDLGLFLCHDGIVCLEMNHICDGFPHCFDKSDETGCLTEKKLNETHCKNIGCSHGCHLAPDQKTVCTCPLGFKLDDSMKNCIDLNECEEFGFCYQKCKNTVGSYECSCEEGYYLTSDGRTCRARGGEPLLLFSSFNQIRGIYLKSLVYFSVSTQQNRVIGVSHNGRHVYWTEISRSEASIMRSNEDGSDRTVIINSGLGLPEDLEVDYITGNIYFTDVEKKHIGVCTEAGLCTVLHNEDIDKPRAIALHPQKSVMFWTDWGRIPKIATSGMDGSHPKVLVQKEVEWPNGLALDTSNDRLYWVDAKATNIETVRLDGTDRRVVLSQAVKHPFSISVFEDMLYWSDWENIQIEKCNKFTGKNHSSLIKEKRSTDVDKSKHYIYGVHIYHPVLHPRVQNPCKDHACSDLCLLSPNNTYKCACPENLTLRSDLHTCRRTSKPLQVAVAGNTNLYFLTPRVLGKLSDKKENLGGKIDNIQCMTYDSLNGYLIISDIVNRKIFRYHVQTKALSYVITSGLGKVTSMSFDSYGNNLYVSDEEKMRVEVWSLTTKFSVPVYKAIAGEIPKSVVVVPDHFVFFVAVSSSNGVIILNRVNMDGTQILPHITGSRIVGPNIVLSYDKSLQKIFFMDSGAEIIESMNIDGSARQVVQITEGTPVSMISQQGLLMWINQNSLNFYSHEISPLGDLIPYGKSIVKLAAENDYPKALAVITELESHNLHPCQDYLKHGCSHLCLVTANGNGICACPLGMHLATDNKTCLNPAQCTSSQFKCRTEDICISRIQRCDGHPDCPSKDDEKDCESENCRENQFKCANGQCITLSEKCDNEYDCSDHSDEAHCPFFCQNKGDNFQCGSGECIPKLWKCDGTPDCHDESDEHNCGISTCSLNMFRCKNGMCISARWECDEEIDCADASDEHDACEVKNCKANEFKCGNNRCVSTKLICNGENDCGDNTDEFHCSVHDREPSCGVDEMLCSKTNLKCVPQKSRCNGTAECPRGEDEKDCSNCPPSEFQCKNLKCIINTWVCDKENDCGDNSDEDPIMCSRKLGNVGTVQSCEGFSCKNGECLPLHLVCNGFSNCADGSDEGTNCDSVCKQSPCDHICVRTPIAARCECRQGYFLSSDGHTCIDVDECAQEKCSQICHNIPGGFNCSCVDGYLLKPDRMTCKAKGERMSFILSGDDEIRKVSHNFNHIELLIFDPGAQILGLDVDARKNQIYWSSGSSSRISVLDVASDQKSFMENIDRPGKLAYDWLTGNVYYIDKTIPNSIKVCHLANKKRSTVLTVSREVIISNLAVDPPSGLIFYTQVRSSALQRPVSEIFSYSYTNQNSSVLVTSDVSWVSGIAIDPIRRLVYWCDLYYQVIEKVKYDGTQRQIVFEAEVHRPESLVLFEDSLVWLTRGSSEIKKCVVYGEDKGHCETISLYVHDIKFMTIIQEARQPNMTNPCSDSCDVYSICVAAPAGTKCICEDGTIVSPNEICDHSDLKNYAESRSFEDNTKLFLTYQKPVSSGSSSAVIGILTTMLVICGLVAAYLYIKKKKSNVILETMHFQNPSFGLSHLKSNFHPSELVPGEHRYENPATKLIQQHSDEKYGMVFKGSGRRQEKNKRNSLRDYDSDSDTCERTDMRANLIP